MKSRKPNTSPLFAMLTSSTYRVFGLLLTVLCPLFALAQDGTLDPNFANNGIQITNINNSVDYSKDLAVQADGKIVLAGKTYLAPSLDFLILRYEADGSSLDPTFGTNGVVSIDINGSQVFDEAEAVAIQADGKIVVTGRSKSGGDFQFTTLRLLSDGTLDNTFGTNGLVLTSMGGEDIVRDMLLQDDGKIVVAGGGQVSLVSNQKAYAIARYLANGDLDEYISAAEPGFDVDGKSLTTIHQSTEDEIRGITLNPSNGDLIAAGNSKINNQLDISMAIFDEDGVKLLDNSWDVSGNNRKDEAWDVQLQSDGNILIAGFTEDGMSKNAFLLRLLPDGSLDNSFGVGGIVTSDFGAGNDDEWRSIALLPSGHILVHGVVTNSTSNKDLMIARYLPDGTLDTSFGTQSGLTFSDLNGNSEDEVLQNSLLIPQGSLNYQLLLTGLTQTNDGTSDNTFIAAYEIEDCRTTPLVLEGSALEDSLAAVALYHNTHGDYWCDNTNWLTDAPLNEWYGISTEKFCATGEKRIVSIDLSNNNLRGSVSTYIDALYYLETLLLNDNRIQFLGTIFQTSPWNPNNLPNLVNVNNNALHYPNLVNNSCWLSQIGVYQEQHLDTVTLYRDGGFSSPDVIPFENWNEESMAYIADYMGTDFQWYLDDTQLSATDQTYSPQPYGTEDMFRVFSRQTTFPEITDGCFLEEVDIYAHFDLVIFEITGNGLGVHVPNQFIVKYDLDINPDSLAAYERLLADTLGATMLKECPCGPNIQLWSVDLEEIELEVIRCTTENKSEVDTTEFNFLFSYRKQQAFMEIVSFPDTSYLDFNPHSSDADPILVAISDSGVEQNNAYINAELWKNGEENDEDNCVLEDLIGYDFRNQIGHPQDLNNHGTAVNGIIGRAYSGGSMAMMNTKFYQDNYGQLFDAVCGMHYAMDNEAKVINLSWGYYSDTSSIILRDAIERAQNEDVLLVTSAGNGVPGQGQLSNDEVQKWPANFMRDFDNIIVVGSYHVRNPDEAIIYPNYSNYGVETVHLAAPGHTRTTNTLGGLSEFQGTSIAAPFVSRAAAALMHEFPDLSSIQVKNCILSTVTVLPVFADRVITSGMLDFEAARACAASSLAVDWLHVNGEWTANQQVELTWEVQHEVDLDYYEIWKSEDGKNWQELTQVAAQSHAETFKKYQYIDQAPFEATNYYKIRQVDRNGKKEESDIILVQAFHRPQQIQVYPNPVVQHQFQLSRSFAAPTQLKIVNLQGQVVYQQTLSAGQTQVTLPPKLSGMMILVVFNKKERFQEKIFVY